MRETIHRDMSGDSYFLPLVASNTSEPASLRFDQIELETFLAVIELGSFAAAKRMHVSQPSVTNRVQRFESILKTKRVERTTCRVMATADGELLAVRARAALSGLREVAIVPCARGVVAASQCRRDHTHAGRLDPSPPVPDVR